MGGSSGGGGRTPYEAPDNLKSAQKLRAMGLISLGPIRGAVTADQYQSVFFDNTPLKNSQGEWNYLNTEIQYNLGTQDQLPLQGFEMSEREVSVGAEVKHEHALSRSVIDPDITRIRVTLGVNALFSQNDQGDTNGTAVDFQILINNQPILSPRIEGKSSSRFFRSYILDNLPPRPFTLTVKRLTADSKSQRLQNGTFWSSYTEIIDTQLSYPNMAMVGIKTDSRYNPNMPNMNFLLYGRLVKVPANYDPDTRTYETGIWKGDWKFAWTNNPAWVFYDLVTNKLAGLGQRLGDYGIDKFQLYQIARYCDELVDDGYGGKEPRMTANLWITEQRDAYSVISDMASVFRAIVVWNGTQMTAIQDRPADPVFRFTQANVINGRFSRQYVPLKSIYTAVEVEYIDERNQYQKAIEYVADDEMIVRYGYNVKKIQAFACTSRGQARRYGKWALETSRLEQCTLTFSVGREGLQVLPGDIIEVADTAYSGINLGGRVLAVSGKMVTLDRPIEFDKQSYLAYTIDTDNGKKIIRHKIVGVAKDNAALVTLDKPADGLNPFDAWVLHTPKVSTERYRVLSIGENDDGSYSITALQHEPQKEAIVDNAAVFEPVSTSRLRGGLQAVTSADVSADGNGITLTFSPPSFVGQGLKYQVKLYRNGKLYQIYDDLKEPQLGFGELPDGEYVAEVRAKNGAGQLSDPTTSSFTINYTITELVTVPKIFAIDLSWKNPLFAKPNSAVEIWVSSDNNFQHARKLVSLAYPTNHYSYTGLSQSDRFWFWARMTDGTSAGQFTDAVEGVPEQNATALTEYLNGQITETHLGKSLIDSLQNDIDEAVGEEAKARQAAVANVGAQILAEARERTKAIGEEAKARTAAMTAEANNRTKAIQAEAQARGTAITALQNVDKEQAKLITAATAKADNALSGLEAEKIARANADSAEAQARSALTSRVASAESGITALQRSVTSQAEALTESSKVLTAKIDGVQANLTAYQSTQATKEQVTAQKLTQLESGLGSKANASALNNYYTKAQADNAVSQQVDNLKAVMNTELGKKATQASLEAFKAAQATLDSSQAEQMATLTSRVAGAESQISRVENTVSTLSGSTASQINQLNAKFEPINAQLAKKANAPGQKVLDLTSLDADKWYPVTFHSAAPHERLNILIEQQLRQVDHSPHWATHNTKSFSLLCSWATNGGGWGTIAINRQIETFEYGWTKDNLSPLLNIGQLTNSNIEYCYLRGGAKYNVFTSRADVGINIQTTTYTVSGQSVSVLDSYNAALVPKSTVKQINAAISEERTARANADSALGQRIDTVTASINDTKAQVSQVSNAVAEANGKLAATHTLKTQVIAGGRTAIAGIALGATADNKTKESSVIVMADKFGVVKNASDGNVVSMLSVVNNKVAINGDLIADGTITGKHIKANQALSSPVISGGSITGNRINGSTISGGTISGTTISGTNINGGNISGSTISGGVIKGTRFEGATGSFTGTLTVGQLLGSNILEVVKIRNVSYRKVNEGHRDDRTEYNVYSKTINIKAAPVERFFFILNSNISETIPANQSKVINYHSKSVPIPPEINHSSSEISLVVMLIATTSAKTVS